MGNSIVPRDLDVDFAAVPRHWLGGHATGSHIANGVNMLFPVVVVTGAGSGIGRATALAFAMEGARIVATDLHQDRLDSLTAELGASALLVRQVDVADRAAMAAFAAAVHERAPAADVVVNNAGVAIGGPFLDTTLDDWDWLLGINLRGVVHGCHFFAPRMVARGSGHLVNIASILGIYAAPNVTAYGASKFAVLGFSQSLRPGRAGGDPAPRRAHQQASERLVGAGPTG